MSTVITKMNGCIFQIILNRSEKRNAFNSEMIKLLTNIFSSLSASDPKPRIIFISGAGNDFCGGADLNWMISCGSLSDAENYREADKLFQMYQSMHDCPIPIIAFVHGHIFGGGVGLCAASDIVIADNKSIFSLSETKRGLIPAVMMPFVIDKLGKSRTKELLITGRTFTSEEAMNDGLIHFNTTKENKFSLIKLIVDQIISCAPEAISECKQLIHFFPFITRHHLIESLANKRSSKEAQEGLNAFVEKRLPAWTKAEWSLDGLEI